MKNVNLALLKRLSTVSFTLLIVSSCVKEDTPTPPPSPSPNVLTVTTNIPTEITDKQAKLGGRIVSDGGSAVTKRGICYGLSSNPTIEDTINNRVFEMGTGIGEFSDTFDGFLPSTTIHVRAFAINDRGITYGENKVFTTLDSLVGCPIISVGSNISTPTTWVKGNVYVILQNVSINSTLTIESGTIIKLNGSRISVNGSGKILANGTTAERIVFTSYFDDSFCGDTNKDGAATIANKGDWTSIYLNGGTGNTFRYCDFLYAGKDDGGYNNCVLISVAGPSFEFDNCTFAHTLGGTGSVDFAFHGGSYMEDSAISKFTNNAFYDNDRPLFINTYYNLSPTNIFYNPSNVSQKNARNGIWLYNTTKQGQTITFGVPNVPYVITAFFNGGGSGATGVVNINANVIVKFAGVNAGISSGNQRTLNLDPSASLTSILDDSRGGDTNGDGNASTPAAGDWDGYFDYTTNTYQTRPNIFFSRII